MSDAQATQLALEDHARSIGQTANQHEENEWEEGLQQLLESDDMQGFQSLASITNYGELWGSDLLLFVFE
jgi:hypothetical protein